MNHQPVLLIYIDLQLFLVSYFGSVLIWSFVSSMSLFIQRAPEAQSELFPGQIASGAKWMFLSIPTLFVGRYIGRFRHWQSVQYLFVSIINCSVLQASAVYCTTPRTYQISHFGYG